MPESASPADRARRAADRDRDETRRPGSCCERRRRGGRRACAEAPGLRAGACACRGSRCRRCCCRVAAMRTSAVFCRHSRDFLRRRACERPAGAPIASADCARSPPRRLQRAARRELRLRLVAAPADRELGRADAAARAVGEEPLHPAVLERVEARSPPSRPPLDEQRPGGGSARSSDSSSPLTAIRIAWKVRFAGWPRPKRYAGGTAARIASTSSQVVSSGRRRTISAAIERAWRSSPSSRIAAASRVAGHSLTTSSALRRLRGVHPHVERRVVGVGEAALGGVELERGDPEVHEDDVGAHAARREALERVGEVGADEARSADRAPARARRSARRRRVAVDRDQGPGRPDPLGGQPGVAAAAERAVDRPSSPGPGSVSAISSGARTGTCSVGM